MTLQFKIRGQTLYKLTPGDAVEGTRNYINCQFDFQTEDWEGCIKTALFQPPGGVEPYSVMLVDDTCTVPWEALEHPGLVSVSVFGVKDDYKITSSVVQIRNRATLTGGAATEPPTPTVYEQVLNDLAGTRQHATEQAQESKAAADEAKGYADSAASVVDGFDAAAEAASKAITAEGALQASNVQSAGQTAIQSVSAEGESQVAAVGAAGTEALQAVQDAAAEIVADREQISTNKDNIASLQSEMRTKADAIVRTVSGESLLVQDSSDNAARGLRVFGKTTQDGTPTPDAPVPLVSVGDAGSVEVGVYGKNLLKNTKTSETINGVAFTVNEDGSIIANGTATGWAELVLETTLPKGSYILSGCPSGGSINTYLIYLPRSRNGFESDIHDIGNGNTFTLEKTQKVYAYIVAVRGTTLSNAVFEPMIRPVDTDDTYEPYRRQSLTLQTPTGLPGIPVTDASLATYTDADGQMWCSDEVDFGRGVYVQRIYNVTYDGSDDEALVQESCALGYRYHTTFPYAVIKSDLTTGQKSMNSDFLLGQEGHTYLEGNIYTINFVNNEYKLYVSLNGNESLEEFKMYLAEKPMTVLAILAEPIETPLTSDILSMYSMLHTNYPVTTVLNDGGAGMEMQYNADTQLYIDNKIAEVLASIANTNAQLL